MGKPCFVGIDTSNYTTSLAISDANGVIIKNLKFPLSVKSGEKGLRQSDAVFLHIKNLPEIFSMANDCFLEYTPVAIGVSVSPRSTEGSYMPCFLAGKASAYSMSAALGIPVYETSHQQGHIMAAAYSGGVDLQILNSPFLAFHVSGGTTDVLFVTPDDYGFHCERVGGTRDINAGQAIDRIGVYMGIDFPCGATLEQLALSYNGIFVKPKICVADGYCNLSGLENKAIEIYEKSKNSAETAAYTFNFIGETLLAVTEDIRKKYGALPVIYSGGVMSSFVLKERLRFDGAYFSEPQFSSDNAAGVALLCRRRHLSK